MIQIGCHPLRHIIFCPFGVGIPPSPPGYHPKPLQLELPQSLGVGAEIGARIVVGAVAFAALMSLEVALAVGLFHRPIGRYLAGLRSLAGAIGLAAQVCFATFPLASAIKRQRLNP